MDKLNVKTFNGKDHTVEQLVEMVEQERAHQQSRRSIAAIDAMLKEMDQQKPRKIKVRNQGGQLS